MSELCKRRRKLWEEMLPEKTLSGLAMEVDTAFVEQRCIKM